MIEHPIPPVFDENSEILILGSFPSVRSREVGFFYGHNQNRFWRVISTLFGREMPESIEEKRELLLSARVAVWDVIASCDILASSDSSIKNVRPNNISQILERANIRAIFVNGKTAEKFYNRYIKNIVGREAICLPSTSGANATYSLQMLVDAWREKIFDRLG